MLIIWLIRVYQVTVSRLTMPCPCPESCSDYAIRMIRAHGGRVGLGIALDRVEAGCTTAAT